MAEERARIDRYAAGNGLTRATCHFSKMWDRTVPETTACRLKQEFLVAMKSFITTHPISNLDPSSSGPKVSALPEVVTGRPLLLGKHLDGLIQEYISALCKTGGTVNTSLVRGAAEGIVTAKNPGLLAKHGEHIEQNSFSNEWAMLNVRVLMQERSLWLIFKKSKMCSLLTFLQNVGPNRH